MHIAIIGGTGFVGSYIVDQLVAEGYEVSQLVRPGSEQKLRHAKQSRIVSGELESQVSVRDLLSGCDAVIYCVGILREDRKRGVTFEATQFDGVVTAVEAAKAEGIKRFVLMSANGVRVPGTRYQETKKRAEEYVLDSGLQATVVRPSVIFGDPRGRMEFATQLFRDMVNTPIPAVGFFSGLRPTSGAVVMSPVHVKDVATVFVNLLKDSASCGQTYALGGPEVLSWPTMLQRIAEATRRSKWIIPMPIGLMQLGATLLDWIPAFPVTRDQLTMLKEGNTADADIIENVLGYPPTAMTASQLDYLNGAE